MLCSLPRSLLSPIVIPALVPLSTKITYQSPKPSSIFPSRISPSASIPSIRNKRNFLSSFSSIFSRSASGMATSQTAGSIHDFTVKTRPDPRTQKTTYQAGGDMLASQNLYNSSQQPVQDVVILTNQQLQDLIESHAQTAEILKMRRTHIDERSPLSVDVQSVLISKDFVNPVITYYSGNLVGVTSDWFATLQDARGNDVALSTYKGKVLLIVNVASQCGLTNSNYTELAKLYEQYKDQGLEILAFPCNQFGAQEPGTNEEILEFACTRFKAEYPIFDKVDVNGDSAAPIYKYLKSSKGSLFGDGIKWNFTKFLVDKEGHVVDRYAPTTSPLSIEKDIKKLLA